jgi:hypothetical protein
MTVNRIACPHCAAQCIESEQTCWQCGKPLRTDQTAGNAASAVNGQGGQTNGPSARENAAGGLLSKVLRKPAPTPPAEPQKPLINFEPGATAAEIAPRRTVVTLTGEIVEVEEPEPPTLIQNAQAAPDPSAPAAIIGGESVEAGPTQHLIRLTWCKNCGFDNPEGVVECVKCKNMLEVVDAKDAPGEIEPLPRAWGFDVLGGIWCVLGLAAIYCGQFLVKTDASRKATTWSDYFWTGVVACAPGVFIFLRHHFCKLLFWVMSLASALVWSVIGVVWITGHLYVSDNGQIGLEWLFALTILSVVSYYTVRQNDAFDFTG